MRIKPHREGRLDPPTPGKTGPPQISLYDRQANPAGARCQEKIRSFGQLTAGVPERVSPGAETDDTSPPMHPPLRRVPARLLTTRRLEAARRTRVQDRPAADKMHPVGAG